MKQKLHSYFASVALCAGVVIMLGGCQSTPERIAYNTADSLNAAVNAAEMVWVSYNGRQARETLLANGNATPSAAAILLQMEAHPRYRQLQKLDDDYRASMTALVQALAAQTAAKAAGSSFTLDPVFRARAVAAANAVIEAVASITNQPLKEVK